MKQGVKRKIEKYFTIKGIVLLSKFNKNECTHFFFPNTKCRSMLMKKLEIILIIAFKNLIKTVKRFRETLIYLQQIYLEL